MGTGGRWVGTRPSPGSCLSMGPALLGLFKSCGHTQWRAMDAPFLALFFYTCSTTCSSEGPQPLAFSSCWLHPLPAPPPLQAPRRDSSGFPTGQIPLSFLPHVLPSIAWLAGLCARLPHRVLLASLHLTFLL